MSNDEYKSASEDPAVRLTECRGERNQCDGCQAGIPLINGAHRMGKPGGYPDKMSCTANLYAKATILQDANVRYAGNTSSLTISSQQTQEKQAVPAFDEEAERAAFAVWFLKFTLTDLTAGNNQSAFIAGAFRDVYWQGWLACAKSRAEGK